MEKSWIKIVSLDGRCLVRCKNPYLAATKIVWAADHVPVRNDVKLLIDGYDYGSCNFITHTHFFEQEVAIALAHIRDCLKIHEAFYEESLDFIKERE